MKRTKMLLVTGIMIMAMSNTAHAAAWKTGIAPNETRWWYDNEDGTYARNGWYWLDGNQDGVAECYYFDSEGWMAAGTTTPDGYEVNENGAWIVGGIPQTQEIISADAEAEEIMRIQVQSGDTILRFELNDSPAARDLYRQLPLTISVSDYSSNEKIFYPPEELNTMETPKADGGAGTLAYYRPWGNVVIFYGDFRSNNSLYELGRVTDGEEMIGTLTGILEISQVQ